ncbi:MAG: type II toxin-antitoxin system HicB family antitoxin [Candidatus Aenigmarchaeota archaeon]|nr:type II toxin-antitoxin system HicB family antitoxin [Candidatus Aenigmarchaeota archaeon]
MRNFRLSVVIEKDKDGYYAFCPELQGCYTQGKDYEEVLKNIADAMKLHIKDRILSREEISQPEMTSLTQIEVAV